MAGTLMVRQQYAPMDGDVIYKGANILNALYFLCTEILTEVE